MMLVPRRNSDLWEDFFNDSFFSNHENKIMKTDIREKDDKYIIDIDLPGFEKKDIKIDVTKGYLTINAKTSSSSEEGTKDTYIKRERYSGECQRSFFVGDNIKAEDVKASFKNGILSIDIPRKENLPDDKENNVVEIND